MDKPSKPSRSIHPLLKEWAFDPTRVTARFVDLAPDQPQQVQLRLDLGILQMRLDGRPDGERPHGSEYALHHYRQRLLTERRSGYRLDPDACAELQQECVQIYYRYLALMVLKDFDRVTRDTQHSLDIMELVERHAEFDDLVWEFIQFKPYVLMMNARGKAEKAAASAKLDEAVRYVEQAISDIQSFMLQMDDEPDSTGDCQEITMLQDLIEELQNREGAENPVVALKLKMQHAVHMENFEEAARLRDSIRQMETGMISKV